jgi:Tfp pilus assembly protein PilX
MADRSEEARHRAEASFKKREQQPKAADKIWAERAVAATASDKNAARLKSLRLARDAAATPTQSTAKVTKSKNPATQSSTPASTDVLVHNPEAREVLPTHRQLPTKVARSHKKSRLG